MHALLSFQVTMLCSGLLQVLCSVACTYMLYISFTILFIRVGDTV